MVHEISPYLRSQFVNGELDDLFRLDEGLGFELYHQILNFKGKHVSIIGDSRSGKSEKGKYFDWWFSRMGETLIIFDTGKDGDLECYFDNSDPAFRFNKPVQILIPYEGGCKFIVKGAPKNIEVRIIPVMAPSMYFDMIQKGWINIISLRNYFQDVQKLKRYMKEMIKNFSLRARLGDFDAWTPAVLKIDEAHESMGKQSVAKDRESIMLSMEFANMERQLASAKIRMEIITQSYYDLPEAVAKNTHCFIVCRGAYAEKRDSKAINYLQGFAEQAREWQGWIVIHGRHFYSTCPIPFPLMGTPENIRIYYEGFADGPENVEDEVSELLIDAGWRGAGFVRGVEKGLSLSLGNLPAVVETDEENPVIDNTVAVWGTREELKQEVKES
jgi:hypothetical protein